jgi:uncharacterized protein (TIGR03067 family)
MGCRAILFLGLALAASGGSDDAVKKELKKFQGTWKVVRMQVDGVKIPVEAFDKTTVVVEGDKFSFRDKGRVYEEIEVVLDVAKKPREIDLHFVTGLKKGVTEKGLYELDGDTLKICQSLNLKKRPTDLESGKGSAQQRMVLKRQPG